MWKDGKRCGRGISARTVGTQLFADGGKYDGEWKDDKKSGKGKDAGDVGLYIFSNRGRYEGEMKEGIVDGKGSPRFHPRRLLLP